MFFYEKGNRIYYLDNLGKFVVPIDTKAFKTGVSPDELFCTIINFADFDKDDFIRKVNPLLNTDNIPQDDVVVTITEILLTSIMGSYNPLSDILLWQYFIGQAFNDVIQYLDNDASYFTGLTISQYRHFVGALAEKIELAIEYIQVFTYGLLSPDIQKRLDSPATSEDIETTKGFYAAQDTKLMILPTTQDTIIKLYEIRTGDLISFVFYSYGNITKKLCRCKNCGRLFIPSLRKEEIYCTHKNTNGKTCKEIGYENTMDDIDKAFRKAYKTKNAFKNRNLKNKPNVQAVFDDWVDHAQYLRDFLRDGIVSEEEYYEHLGKKLL